MAGFKHGLQKVGDVYHYCFRIHGRQFKGSTRARDLQTARKVLEERRQQVLLGKPIVPVRAPLVADLVRDWLVNHQASLSIGHLRNVETTSRLWILPACGKLRINEFGTSRLLEIQTAMLGAGRSIASVNHLQRVAKLLWNHAVSIGLLDHVPFKAKPLRSQRKPRPILGAERVPEFLSAVDVEARNPQVRVMVRVMLGLGLRESEVLGMRWAWFNPEYLTYTVGKAKGKEARVLPVPAWLWTALHSAPKQISEWVFPAADGKPHRPHLCSKVLKRVCSRLNLGKVTPHRLRATFASLHAEAGTPITEIQGMLGHKSITTTMIYVEQSLEAKKRAQDKLSQRLGLA